MWCPSRSNSVGFLSGNSSRNSFVELFIVSVVSVLQVKGCGPTSSVSSLLSLSVNFISKCVSSYSVTY